MNANMVSWSDYGGVDGFGVSSPEEVYELNKALTAGNSIAAPGSVTAGDGFALRVESLERTLKNLTYRMEHFKLWKNITKMAAYNTVEEFNTLLSYGENQDAGWIAEGDLPNEVDSSYKRNFVKIKYLGVVGRVTHVMSLVRPAHQNVIAQETVNKTMVLLKMIERGLFKGDSSLDDFQFDGYEKMITDNSPSANIIDKRGLPLSQDDLIAASLIIFDAPNYGSPTDLYCNPKVKADLARTFFPDGRYDIFNKPASGMIGLDIKGCTTPAGDIQFQPDVFIDDGGAPSATAVGDITKIPATPTVGSVTTPTASPTSLSKFTADDLGVYTYKAVACNRYGKSAPCAVGPCSALVVTDCVTFTLTPGSAIVPAWYEIYRTKKDVATGTERLILRVANAGGAGTQAIFDYNASLPYCTSSYMFQQNADCMSVKQLAPMLKIPLATIDSSIRWQQLVYMAPVLYAPGRVVLFKNVGLASGYNV